LTVLVTALAVFLLFGRFSLTKAIAGLIPYRVAENMGSRSAQLFRGSDAPTCEGAAGMKALQKILARLENNTGQGPPFQIHVSRWRVSNAFALPGRHIVVLSGLIDGASSPEEIAGVIAHEMGHGLEKDPEALLVRSVGMQVLIQLITGQSGDQNGFAFGAVLLQLRYSRDAERLADSHAREILRKAGISPKPVGEFFERFAERGTDGDGAWQYLSTHPSSRERAKLFFAEPTYLTKPILTDKEWADLRAVCGKKEDKKEDKAPDSGAGKPQGRGANKKTNKPETI
jgi:predicted Zn-dependent protease